MNGLNSFMSLSVPAGRIAGINIRIHILFLLYAAVEVFKATEQGFLFGLLIFLGLYVCILLHELGHSLSSRWCGGEADEILIWPLGGLAYCRPPLNPTPHLITTLGGPFVTLMIWALLTPLAWWLKPDFSSSVSSTQVWTWAYFDHLAKVNLFLLLFNLVPAFPLDGGRALRDTLWHFMPMQKANKIAGITGVIASVILISYGVQTQNQWMVFIGIYAIFGAVQELSAYQDIEPWQIVPWSLREQLGMPERSSQQQPRKIKRSRLRGAAPVKDPKLVYEQKLVPRPEIQGDRAPVAKIDAILEKISRSGIDSLDEWERRELDRASKELKRLDQ